jgi:hypothetical protein
MSAARKTLLPTLTTWPLAHLTIGKPVTNQSCVARGMKGNTGSF